MISSGRRLRRRLCRVLESLCVPLFALLVSKVTSAGSRGRQRFHYHLPPPVYSSTTARRFDFRSVLGAVVGRRTAIQRNAFWLAVGVIFLVGGVGLALLHVELTVFSFIDRLVCLSFTPADPESFTSALASARTLVLPSNHVVLRAVYHDPRPRDGHLNVSVFLAEVHKEILAEGDAIVGCGVGTAVSRVLKVHVVGNSWWAHKVEPHLTHDVVIIDCFGLPQARPGARAFLWYRLPGTPGIEDNNGGDRRLQLYRVESEHPYFIPRPKQTQNHDDLKVVVCMAIVRDHPPFIREFLRYYKHLGVDHVYMTAEDSFITNGVLLGDEFIREALMEGFISFSFWHMWLNTDEVFYHSQMLAHQDCIYRLQGTYDYVFLVDSDDHFIPLLPERKTLDFYIEHYCRFGACTLQWLEFFPDCGQDWSKLGHHGNVTNTLTSKTHHLRFGTGKTVYRLSGVLDAGTHIPMRMLTGYKRLSVPPHVAYVAHVRRNKHPPHGLQSC